MGVIGFDEFSTKRRVNRARAILPPGFRRWTPSPKPHAQSLRVGHGHRGHLGLGAGGFTPTYTSGAPRVGLSEIPDGIQGTVATLDKMREAVLGPEGAHNKDVRFLAQKIVEDVGNKDYVGEAQAIFDFMRKHVRYTLDPRGLEWVQTPWWTLLVMGQGDCDDHSVATCALATSLGHGCGFRTVKGDPSRPSDYSHVYAVIGVRKNGQELWLPADSTEKYATLGSDPPGAENMEKKTWVLVPA